MKADLRTLARTAGIALPLIFGLFAGRLLSPWLPEFSARVHALGVWAPAAFLGAYVLVVMLMLPAFLLIMVAGAVFGMVEGSILVMVGALIGGTLAFLVARYLARERVARRVAKHPLMASIDRVIGEDGLKLVFLLRLSPAVPFVLTNYALGVTRVRLLDFVIGTFGLLPIVVILAAYGSAAGGPPHPDGSSPVSPVALTFGIVATVVLGVLLARIAQRAVREAELQRGLAAASHGS